MNGQKQKFSELKKQAREAMAGRCGTLVGATAIISTNKGVVTDKEARKLGVGGEVLCFVW